MQPRLSIRSKLFLSILLIILLSFSALSYNILRSLDATLEDMLNRELSENLKYASSQYLARADMIKFSLMQPASAAPVHGWLQRRDRGRLKEALLRWRRVLPFVELLTIVDADGRVIARVNGDLAGDRLELNNILHRAFRERQPVVATELISRRQLELEQGTDYATYPAETGNAMMIAIVIPVVAADGAILGAVVAGDILNRDPHLPFQTQQVFGREVEVIITQGGNRIAGSLAQDVSLPATLTEAMLARLEKGLPYQGESLIRGRLYKTVFTPITDNKGKVVGSLGVALSKEQINKVRRENLRNILASAGIAICLAFGLAYFVARRFTVPLSTLTMGVQQIEKGDLTQRLVVSGSDEFGMLADSFNRMACALAERDTTIRKKTLDLEGLNLRLQEMNELLERKVTERTSALRMEMGRLEAILTSMVEGVVVTDQEDRVILFNPAAQKLFDMVPHRVVAQPIEEICDLGGFCLLVDYIREVRSGGGTFSGREVEMESKGKKLKANISPLLDEALGFAGVVMSVRDVTMEEEVDRMKTEFISTVSHELKTPLTSIKGSLHFIMNKAKWLTGTERELLTVCLRNTDRLIRLINDILDISKIEAGRMEFTFRSLSVAELVIYSLEEIRGFAMSRNVTLINNVGTDLPLIYGDHDRLIQVLTNLLSNAVKFSPENKAIMVDATRQGNYVTVSVADRGKAIQWSDREKLFKKFQQLDANGIREGGGTGLGLAICKEIIERHHGRIYYEEGASGGNVFSFTVPVHEEG